MDLAEGGSDHFFHNKFTANYTVRVVRHIAGLVRIQLDSEMRAFRGIGPQFPSVLQVGDSRRCHVNSLPKIGYFGSGHPRTMTWAEAASVESTIGSRHE
jgi:hypothetical protein